MKYSNIPWIGDVPKEWEIDTIGNLYSLRNEKVSDKDYPPLSVTKMGIVPQLETAAKTDDGDNRKLVRVGDFAINSRSDRRGSCGISAYDGSVSLINTVITPREQMNPRFYNWLFHSELFADEFYKWGHGIVDDLWTTRWQEMKRISIVAPSLEEQQKIASFLDRKCSEINEMIALQEKIVEELKAYKQSVITEAVTKGLNPDAPMKDSGIDWIGEIPEHWNVKKLKRIVKVSDGTHDTPEYIDKDRNSYPLVTSRCIVDGEIDISLAHHISEQDYIEISKRSAVSKYDVIMPMIGTVGNPAILMTDDKIAIKNVALFRTYGDLDKAKYIKYYLNSLLVKEQFNFTFRGGVQNFVSQDIIKNLLFLMPEDYREVVNLLDTKCTEIDNLISIKLSKIDSLKEYKKSIIYEYVTGKKEVIE